jgi:hypothetical protein
MKLEFTTKEKLNKRFESVKSEFQLWTAALKELKKYINPTRGKFDDTTNRGTMIDHKTILDGHATQACRILASGMQSGMTSPSRPWMRLEVADKSLMAVQRVRMWLDEVTELLLEVCANSNIYSIFYTLYEEIGTFGFGAAAVLEDYKDIFRGRSFTVGTYYFAIDERGVVDTFAREFQQTIGQTVKMFGYKNCSDAVKVKYDNNRIDEWVKIRHLIEPNDNRIKGQLGLNGMAYRSVYWEPDQADTALAVKGFEEFPILAPRWDVPTTDTIYAYGPGWHALGNVKQLQKTVLDKLLAQEKSHNPPLQADGSVDGFVDILPGGITRTSSTISNGGVRPAYQVNPNLESFIELINSLKEAINKDFFVDLFLMMINFDKSNMTATEVAERQQEKIMMMGPVLERLQKEMLEPFIERIYGIMERNMLIPPAPEELEGAELKVSYVSILAQAQKAVGIESISRVIGFVNGLAPIQPNVVDVLDTDEIIKEVSRLEGAPAKIINEQMVIQQIREQRQKMEQLLQQLEMADKAATASKNAANAKLGDDNVLSRMAEAGS